MTPLRTTRGVGWVLSMAVFLLGMAAATTVATSLSHSAWHKVAVDASTVLEYGLFDYCYVVGSAARCGEVEITPAAIPGCDVSRTTQTAWFWGLRAGALLGGVFGVIGATCALGGVQMTVGERWHVVSAIFSVAAFVFITATAVTWSFFMPKIYVCGTLCEYLTAQGTPVQDCGENQGTWFWVFVGAGGAQAITTAAAIANFIVHRRPKPEEASKEEATPGSPSQPAPSVTNEPIPG